MLLRTVTNCAFRTLSYDRGRTWVTPMPTQVPNPNTKIHAVVLQPVGGEVIKTAISLGFLPFPPVK